MNSWIIETFNAYHIYRNEEGCDFSKDYTDDELFSLQGPYSEEELNLRIKVLRSLKDPKEFKEMNQDHKRFWIVKLRDKIDNKVALVQYYVDATKAQVDQYLKDYWSGEKPVVLDAFNNAEEAEKRVQELKPLLRVDTIILDPKKSNWTLSGPACRDFLFIDRTWLEVYHYMWEHDLDDQGTIQGPFEWEEIKEVFLNSPWNSTNWIVETK